MTRLVQAVQIFTFLAIVSILISIAASESFLALAFLCWLPVGIRESRIRRRLAVEWPPFFLPIQMFVLATILSVFFSKDPMMGMAAVRKLPLFFLIFLVSHYFDFAWVKRTYVGLFSVGSLVGLFSMGQFVEKWVRFRRTDNPVDDPTLIFRVQGFMGHWMTFSGEQVLVLAALLGFLVLFPLRRKGPWLAATVLVFASVVLSFTRSVWIAAMVMLGVIALRFRSRLVWIVPAVLMLLVLIFPRAIHERMDTFFDRGFSSNVGRIEMARAGWKMFRAHPWFGVGPQRIRPEFEAILRAEGETHPPFYTGHLHNDFIQFAAERGVFALAAFVWLIGELLVRFWRGSKNGLLNPEWRAIYLAGLLATIALAVAGLFEFNFGDSEVFILFLFIISAPYSRFESADVLVGGPAPTAKSSAP